MDSVNEDIRVTYKYVKGVVNQVTSRWVDDYDPDDTTPTCFRSSCRGWWDSYQPLDQPTTEQITIADWHVNQAFEVDWRKVHPHCTLPLSCPITCAYQPAYDEVDEWLENYDNSIDSRHQGHEAYFKGIFGEAKDYYDEYGICLYPLEYYDDYDSGRYGIGYLMDSCRLLHNPERLKTVRHRTLSDCYCDKC